MITVAPQPLSNMQMELLQLYATGISDEHLIEIRDLIARFLFEKARDRADKIWDEKGYNEETVERWLNEE